LLRTVPCEPVECLFGTPRGPPPNLAAAVHAHRQAQWQVGHGFLGLPYRTKYRNCKARQEVSGGNIAVCGVCTETCSPPHVATCWTMPMASQLAARTGPLACTRRRKGA
jgi:hypothetical protein